MKKRNGLTFLLLSLLMFSTSVWAQPFRDGDNFRLGVQMGINATKLVGTELSSPTLKRGMVIGTYYRQQLGDNLHLLTELNFSLRGGNFDFEQENHYYAIKFTSMDLPIQFLLNTRGASKDQFAVLGLEPSYLMQSEIYVNPSFRATYRNYGFKRFDMAALLGYHFDFYYFGLQPSVKLGLLNINDGLRMPEVLPETGKNGTIKNLSFDIKFFF